MSRFINLFFLLFLIFITSSSFAQSVSSGSLGRPREDLNSADSLDRLNSLNRQSAESFANKKEPGFYELESPSMGELSLTNTVVTSLLGTRTHDNLLIVRFVCNLNSSIFNLPMKNKDISWHFEDAEPKGQSQTDSSGLFKIRFSSKDSVQGKRIVFVVKDIKKQITLGKGPYEFSFDESYCSSK